MSYTNTEVRLVNVSLDPENNHTLYFDNINQQTTYFNNLSGRSFNNLTYQRKDNIINIPAHIDSINTYNYVIYKNPDYSNKIYYAFIIDFMYVNDGLTQIKIQTDPIQTYLFNYTFKDSFIERQHVDSDQIGEHTIPEALETGEYICNSKFEDQMLTSYVYLLFVTEIKNMAVYNANGTKSYKNARITNFGGIPAGFGTLVFYSYNNLKQMVEYYDDDGKGDAIIGAIMIPAVFVDINSIDPDGEFFGVTNLLYCNEPEEYVISLDIEHELNGYKPKNNKLYCFPYRYILMSNNNGTSNILEYENFHTSNVDYISNILFADATFKVKGIPTHGGSIKINPVHYKGIESNEEEGIMAGKFPTLSWSSDLFTNWLTQNAVNNGIGLTSSVISLISGIATLSSGVGAGAGIGLIAGGVLGIGKQVGQIYEHSFTPNSAKGNVNGGDINTASSKNTFILYQMSIKKEYAKNIDKYFNMFGYKVNTIGIPLKDHRTNYWYTKTIDANITGSIPPTDLKKIINCYNKGITFWRSTATFKSYSQTNKIIDYQWDEDNFPELQ